MRSWFLKNWFKICSRKIIKSKNWYGKLPLFSEIMTSFSIYATALLLQKKTIGVWLKLLNINEYFCAKISEATVFGKIALYLSEILQKKLFSHHEFVETKPRMNDLYMSQYLNCTLNIYGILNSILIQKKLLVFITIN